MSKQEAKLIYDTMLENGDLFELFQGLTGDWLKDKKNFLKQYEQNQEFIENGNDLDFDNII